MAEASEPKNVLRTVDDEARRLARDLIRRARFGALGVIEPGSGAPSVSRVSLATDVTGAPLILISQLSGHFGALEANPVCSLLVGEPGKGDPLAHPRITLTCRAEKLEGAARQVARSRFLARHPKAGLYADFGDFAFWRIGPERASLNGGFGKAFEMGAADLMSETWPDFAALDRDATEHMNADHADAVQLYATHHLRAPEGAWRLTGCDAEGLDLANGDRIARLWFDRPLSAPKDLQPTLVLLAKRARQST
ncbi:MAG: DUF2470 domain-containing protein [Pseudomonadota bacterium]